MHRKAAVSFNGENLDGWKVVGSPEWNVEENVITVKGTGSEMGWLISEKEYTNFVLRARFQWEGGNSGIQIRSTMEGEKMVGYQVNLDPSRPTATGSILRKTSAGCCRKPN